jgi:hypothetical protein
MRENRLRWFGHVMRQEETNVLVVRVIMKMNVEGKRGRLKKEMVGYD